MLAEQQDGIPYITGPTVSDTVDVTASLAHAVQRMTKHRIAIADFSLYILPSKVLQHINPKQEDAANYSLSSSIMIIVFLSGGRSFISISQTRSTSIFRYSCTTIFRKPEILCPNVSISRFEATN